MAQRNNDFSSLFRKFGYRVLLMAPMLLAAVTLAISADDRKLETLDANAMGTSTQLGQNVSVKITIYDFSTGEDRAILVEAFKQGKQQGLVNALSKMKSVSTQAVVRIGTW